MRLAMIGSLLLVTGTSAIAQQADCQRFTGTTISVADFAQVRSSLPTVEPKGPYESTSDYDNRLAKADHQASSLSAILRGEWGMGRPYYDADKGHIQFFRSDFGQDSLTFRRALRTWGTSGRQSHVLGFVLNRQKTAEATREATNGYGATVTVTQTFEDVTAIWERPFDYDKWPFEEAPRRASKPIEFEVAPALAQEIIENGGLAYLVAPKAPFVTERTTSTEATFRQPKERISNVTVIHADIQCAFIVDSKNTVHLALTVS